MVRAVTGQRSLQNQVRFRHDDSCQNNCASALCSVTSKSPCCGSIPRCAAQHQQQHQHRSFLAPNKHHLSTLFGLQVVGSGGNSSGRWRLPRPTMPPPQPPPPLQPPLRCAASPGRRHRGSCGLLRRQAPLLAVPPLTRLLLAAKPRSVGWQARRRPGSCGRLRLRDPLLANPLSAAQRPPLPLPARLLPQSPRLPGQHPRMLRLPQPRSSSRSGASRSSDMHNSIRSSRPQSSRPQGCWRSHAGSRAMNQSRQASAALQQPKPQGFRPVQPEGQMPGATALPWRRLPRPRRQMQQRAADPDAAAAGPLLMLQDRQLQASLMALAAAAGRQNGWRWMQPNPAVACWAGR